MPLELQVTATVLGIITSLGGLITLLFVPAIRRVLRRRQALDHFLRDWVGEDGEPGRDRVPGVMERLNRLDGELKRNGGSTMKDAVHRIEEKLEEVVEMQADLISQITSSATALADIDARLRKTEAALKEHDAHLTSYARQPKRTA